jgi:hypothetical protein
MTWIGDRHYCKICIPKDNTQIAKDDAVNHPSHYNQGDIECIAAIKEATKGLDGIEAFDTGNAIKYLWRWKQKKGAEDLKKAIFYINHLIEQIEKAPGN